MFTYIKLDSSATSESLVLAHDGIEIGCQFMDWNEPIFKQNAQIDILNIDSSYGANFFKLMPLMSAEEREFRVKIVETNPSSYTFFDGYLDSDAVEQQYLSNRPIRLVASNYISKLENVNIPIVNDINSRSSLIDVISSSFKTIGVDTSIYVNMTICPSGITKQSNNSALNLCVVDNEVFWKNTTEQDNGLEILNKVLKPFDSYLYWWNGNYYIERYDDLYSYPQSYVNYRTDVSYGYNNYGTSVTKYDTSSNIFTNKHIDQGQLLTIQPGLNKIEVKLNSERYTSLVNNDWNPVIDNSTSLSTLPQPYGSWLCWWEYAGEIMGNPLYSHYYVNNSTVIGMTNPLFRNLAPFNEGTISWTYGLWSSFQFTADDPAQYKTTVLKLNYNFAPAGTEVPPRQSAPQDFIVTYAMEIRNHESAGGLYLKQDPNDNRWYIKPGITLADGMNEVIFKDSELEAPGYVKEISVSIPIHDVSQNVFASMKGDYDMVLHIGVTRKRNTDQTNVRSSLLYEYIGDFEITVQQDEQDNLITGLINNKFLNKKTIELDLFDIHNYNYKNGIYTFGGAAQRRTESWHDSKTTDESLPAKLIRNKAKLFQKSRQTISSTIITNQYLKPLSAWYDSNQPTKKFVLVDYQFIPTRKEYTCRWNEYDNDTSININYE